MLSPCIRFCGIDETTMTCRGCYRTIKEIAEWSTMTPQQREEIYDRCVTQQFEAQHDQAKE